MTELQIGDKVSLLSSFEDGEWEGIINFISEDGIVCLVQDSKVDREYTLYADLLSKVAA